MAFKEAARYGGGTNVVAMGGIWDKTAEETDASVIRLLTHVPSQYSIITSIVTNNEIDGATDVDVGLAYSNDGPVIGKDSLRDGITLANARSRNTSIFNRNIAFTQENFPPSLYDIYYESLSDKSTAKRYSSFDVVLTLNTGGTATGKVEYIFMFSTKG